MEFKKRPSKSLVVCGPAPLNADLSPGRNYKAGEEVSLCPKRDGLHERLHAEVLDTNGERLIVRALHPYYAGPTERLVNRGERFEVGRDEVFVVFL